MNALLVWWLLRALRVPGAWLAAALFALHPVQVESVAWITERKNVLMGLFFLLALLAWTRFVERRSGGRWKFYALALGCYVLALFSKTTACTMPVALLLILWLRKKPVSSARVAQVTPFVLLGVAMGLVTIWWERHHQGTQGELFAIGLPERILVASRAVWFYVGKLLWPGTLAFSYPRWAVSASHPINYIWLLAGAGVCGLIFFVRRYAGRSIEVAALFFVTTLSPTLGFIMLYTFRYSFVADHYQYLASIAPLALGAAGITTAFQSPSRQRFLPVICAVLLVGLGVRTWWQGGIYANEETLWRATILANPASWMAYNNLAIQLLHRGRVDEAIASFDQALERDPNYAEGHYNLGNALLRAGRSDEAVSHYRRALEIYPRYAAAHSNLAAVLMERGENAEAMAHLRSASEINPADASGYAQLGRLFLDHGRLDQALPYLQKASEIDPASMEAHYRLAQALAGSGRLEEAIGHVRQAVQLNPESSAGHSSLGSILSETGRLDEALGHLEKALELDPASAEAHYNLANVLLRTGRTSAAIDHYQNATELKPRYAAAHNNLANTLLQIGRSEEAVAQYKKALEINPEYATGHKNLANALRRVGQVDEAVAHSKKAWEIENRAGANSDPLR